MPYYKPLEKLAKSERDHIIEGLQRLRLQIKKDLPVRTNRSTLLLATWNLREFSNSQNRLCESFWYIAEIISSFDLIAVQEIGSEMTALSRLMSILGYKYSYIVTDTPNSEGGNERIAFIYNNGKVKFKNIAGEVYLDSKERDKYKLPEGFARPPFVVAFQASWFKFNLCSVHIYYGENRTDPKTGEKDSIRRKNEISAIAQKLNSRARKEDVSYILLGDFNIERRGDEYYNALVGSNENPTGFYLHPNHQNLNTNTKNTNAFDQIAFNIQNIQLEDLDIHQESEGVRMGVLKYYESIFNDKDYYRPIAEEKYQKQNKTMPPDWNFDNWRTFQMSDHMPLWIELKIDFTDQYLETLKHREEINDNTKTEIPKQ